MAPKFLETFRKLLSARLSLAEQQQVHRAQKILREGYLCTPLIPDSAYLNLNNTCLTELSSGQAERQRAALENPEFRDCISNEARRTDNIRALHYYHALAKGAPLSLAHIVPMVLELRGFYAGAIGQESTEGRIVRASHLSFLSDDADRLEVANFCRVFSDTLAFFPCDVDSGGISDHALRGLLSKKYMARLSAIDDDELFQATLTRLENMPDHIKPQAIMHYADIFRAPGWRAEATEARRRLFEANGIALRKAEEARIAEKFGWIWRLEKKILVAPL